MFSFVHPAFHESFFKRNPCVQGVNFGVEDKYCKISSHCVKTEDGFTTTVALYSSNFGFLTSLAICVLGAETFSDGGAAVFCW